MTVKRPLIVVRRVYFDEFVAGTKTIEYRRHKGMFTARTFWPGREVRIAYNYNVNRFPTLAARVVRFEVRPVRDCGEDHRDVYPDVAPDDGIAMITLELMG